MEHLFEAYRVAGTAVAVYMLTLFIAAIARKDNSIVDIAWGPGILLATVAALTVTDGAGPRAVLSTTLVFIWATRLASRIARRNKGKGEDPRYAKWRKEWGKAWVLRSFLQVFVLQGALMLVVGAPAIFVAAALPSELDLIAVVGLGVWMVGFWFEALGDRQLDRFLMDPANRGKIMDKGLWKYTRHPNYFGEATMWWGLGLIALAVPYGWISLAGPIVITYLLLFVSGVPMTEKMMEGRPDFEAYKKRTSAFVPMPPKEKDL